MIHFDPTISVGTIVNVLGMFIAAFVLWHKIDLRLSKHDLILEQILVWRKKMEDESITRDTIRMLEAEDKRLEEKIESFHHRLRGLEQREIAFIAESKR